MAKKVYITIFIIICLIPAVFMAILGPSKAGANEILSSKPKMGLDVLSQTTDYIGDRFAFRNELISCYSWINAKLFKTSLEDQVVLGKNDWLYYASDLDDYRGIALSDDELNTIAANLEKLQFEVEERGGKFIFTIAPNKSSIHGENMPGYIENKHEDSNAERLLTYLNKHNINYVNLFAPQIPYYKTDSHWTEEGAAIACDMLIGTSYSSGTFSLSGDKHLGDLYEMLYPAFPGTDDEVKYDGELQFTCKDDDNGGNAITIETSGRGEKTLYCWRDSFGITLYPYLADATKTATFSRSTDFDASKCADADIVILEIVERNIKKLL